MNKSIRKLINEKKSCITDEELFTSSQFQRHIEKIVMATAKRYKTKVKVKIINEEKKPSYTNGDRITLNVWWNLKDQYLKNRVDIYESILGIVGHEVGHILHTNFLASIKYFENMEKSNFNYIPDEPNKEDEKTLGDIKRVFNEKNKYKRNKIIEIISFINNILEDRYVEFIVCKNFKGTYRIGIEKNNENAIKKISTVEEQIKKGNSNISILNNLLISYVILNQKLSMNSKCEEKYFKILDDCKENIKENVLSEEAIRRLDSASFIFIKMWPLIKENLHSINEVTLNQYSKKPEGTTEGDKELDFDDISDDLKDNKNEKILLSLGEEIANELVMEELEKLKIANLNTNANNINYGKDHSNFSIKIERKTKVTDGMIKQYLAISKPLIKISKKLQREFISIVENSKGGKLKGQICGKRLDSKRLVNDNRFFYTNKLPQNKSIAIAILVDESGSMYADGRITMSKKTVVILEDFLRSFNIPHIVYGHTESVGSYKVTINNYCDFNTIDCNDKYRLMHIDARFGNRDGMALKYICEQLSKRTEEIKLLINISDGLPSGKNYGGTEAIEDIKSVKKEYERKGIKVFTASIGDDREKIKEIYEDGFLDISNLELLPKKLVKLITSYVR